MREEGNKETKEEKTMGDKSDTTVEEVNEIMKTASEGALNGILTYQTEPLVSIDFNHNPASSNFDSTLTKVSGRLVKVSSWYDNEWGFSNSMIDTTVALMTAKYALRLAAMKNALRGVFFRLSGGPLRETCVRV